MCRYYLWDSVAGLVTRLWDGPSRARILMGQVIFIIWRTPVPALRTRQCTGCWYWGCFHVVKGWGTKVDYILPSSSGVKNEWSCMSSPPYALMVWTERTLLSCMLHKYSTFTKFEFCSHCVCVQYICVLERKATSFIKTLITWSLPWSHCVFCEVRYYIF